MIRNSRRLTSNRPFSSPQLATTKYKKLQHTHTHHTHYIHRQTHIAREIHLHTWGFTLRKQEKKTINRARSLATPETRADKNRNWNRNEPFRNCKSLDKTNKTGPFSVIYYHKRHGKIINNNLITTHEKSDKKKFQQKSSNNQIGTLQFPATSSNSVKER